MHPLKVLAKAAPKTINYKSGGSGTSNVDDVIDWRTAAHSLQGLPQEITNWAFYRFAGQDELLDRVVKSLIAYTTMFAKLKRYKIKLDTLEGIVRVAIAEFTQPSCITCEGSGYKDQEQEIICGTCYGAGRKLMSKRKRCKVIGIDHKGYSASHDNVVKEISRLLSEWESQIIKNVRRKMSEDEE